MKESLLIILLIIQSMISFSQDTIFKMDGSEIKAKVLEIDEEIIKYRFFNQPEGPIRSLKKKDIFLILYQDGTREKFIVENNKNTNQNDEQENEIQKISSSSNRNNSEDSNLRSTNKKYDMRLKNSVFIGVGSTVGGSPGIGYERIIIPGMAIIVAASYIDATVGENVGYGLGLRYYIVKSKAYSGLIFGTGSHYETGGYLGFNKNYLTGLSLLFGYKLYPLKNFSIDLEIGGRYVVEDMITDISPMSYAVSINLSYHF